MSSIFNRSQKPIFISLSPNVEKDDIQLTLKLLIQPWKWKKEKKSNQLKKSTGVENFNWQGTVKEKSAEELEEQFKKYLGVKYTFAFNSGRSAFLAILKGLNFEPGAEILLQAFTCNAAVNPIIWSGLRPVFVDIERETLNLDPQDFKKKITPKSRAVLVQHTFGLPVKLAEIEKICQKYNLILIEDCAHSLGAEYGSRVKRENHPAPSKEGAGSSTFQPRYASGKVGTFGKASFFSFGRDKVISSVYGGMAVANDSRLAQKIKEFQEKCAFPSYFWIFQQLLHPILTHYLIIPLYGFFGAGRWLLLFFQKIKVLSKAVHNLEKKGERPSYFPKKMPQVLAILALNQLRKLKRFNKHREKIAKFYDENLKDLKVFLAKKEKERIYLRYPILIESQETSKILNQLRKRKIFLDNGWQKTPVVPPDTVQEKMEYQWGSCPTAEKVAKEIINLPLHINISLKEARRITKFLKSVTENDSR